MVQNIHGSVSREMIGYKECVSHLSGRAGIGYGDSCILGAWRLGDLRGGLLVANGKGMLRVRQPMVYIMDRLLWIFVRLFIYFERIIIDLVSHWWA